MASFIHQLQWATIFGLLGNTISFMAILSPIPTFYGIYKKRSSEGYQSAPYVVGLMSAMLWILYAFLTPDSAFLKTINSFACFAQTAFVLLFLAYASPRARIQTMKLVGLMNVAGFGATLFVTFFIAKTAGVRVRVLGWVCLLFSLAVFAAPLGVMRQVIRTKSVEYMPLLLSVFLTLSAVVWFFYGLVRKDYYVAIPNVLGFTFGILQMVLYAMYRNANKYSLEVPSQVPLDHKAMKVAKLGAQEIVRPIEASPLGLKVDNANGDGVYAIEICDVNQEMIPIMKKMDVTPKIVMLAAP